MADGSTLQTLRLFYHDTDNVEMKRFISQLHTMKHLKGLDFNKKNRQDRSDCDSSVQGALMDATSTNTSLEHVDLGCTELYFALNWGRRRAFQPQASESSHVSLIWPRLLARAF